MLGFDPTDPFPLLEISAVAYPEAQAHSARVDQWLGLETERIEAAIERRAKVAAPHAGGGTDEEHWIGLPVRTLLTPYTELRHILARLAPLPGDTVIDLGAGYGRMGFVILRHHPGTRFAGYECIPDRVTEGNRCLGHFGESQFAQIELADLQHPGVRPISAPYYFIYDFGSRAAIEKSLNDLRAIARERPITVVGRGRRIRDEIERNQPWLSSVRAPEHFPHSSIYRST